MRHRSPVLPQSCPRRGQSRLDAVEDASRCTPSKAEIVRAKAAPKSSANSLIHEVWPVAGKQRGLGRSVRVKLTADRSLFDKTTAPAEVQAVKQAFEGAALLPEVSADFERASATLPPRVIYVTVTTASLFFSGFVPAAGADAWNGLRDLVGKTLSSPRQSPAPQGGRF